MMKRKVLNAGFVELKNSMGDDLSVVNAARVSFAKQSTTLSPADRGLIKYLYTNRHATPFEHVTFTWHVKAPIFVTREWQRHRAASYNEMSMRYHIPEELEFWVPGEEDFRVQVGKPGAYSFEPFENKTMIPWLQKQMVDHFDVSEQMYRDMINYGVAKEIARSVLPVSVYTEFYYTVNARNFLNFISLRNSEHAQKEIREYAIAMEDIFQSVMPVTYDAFLDSGRIGI
jgi:thymidylate synthase (FAD)